jgi:hypothetical protein
MELITMLLQALTERARPAAKAVLADRQVNWVGRALTGCHGSL